MAGGLFSRLNTRTTGGTITAADDDADLDNIINNLLPAKLDDYSVNNAQMDSTADPYPGASQSLATTLAKEIEHIRFLIAQITGESDWYIDPDTDLATTLAHFSDTTTHGTTGDIVGTTDTQTLSAKTLTTPTIGSFVNATHDHTDAADGGTLPNLAFSVHKNGADQTSVGTSFEIITWPTEEFDTNNDFASNRFTPTVPDKYSLSATLQFSVASDSNLLGVAIYKNGVLYKEKRTETGGPDDQSVSISVIVDANGSSDYFEVYGSNFDSTDTVVGTATVTYFQGSRAG